MSHVQFGVDWSKQHCGVHQADIRVAMRLMPDLRDILMSFPEDCLDYTWDIKVHMLMPRQYPCIPHWHVDNIPRVNGVQNFEAATPEVGMYLWVSGPPLTQFEGGYVDAGKWHRFTQLDKHRGAPAADYGWRGFIRATHRDIMLPKKGDHQRRHTQVYLDAEGYTW